MDPDFQDVLYVGLFYHLGNKGERDLTKLSRRYANLWQNDDGSKRRRERYILWADDHGCF